MKIQDAIDARRFLTLYSLRGSEAVYTHVDQTINTSARNAALREWKRRWARASLLLSWSRRSSWQPAGN